MRLVCGMCALSGYVMICAFDIYFGNDHDAQKQYSMVELIVSLKILVYVNKKRDGEQNHIKNSMFDIVVIKPSLQSISLIVICWLGLANI